MPANYARRSGFRWLALGTGSIALLTIAVLGQQGPAQSSQKAGHHGFPDLSKLVPPMEETGFTPIFDGKSLNGWDCDPEFWRVDDGVIVGETKMNHQPKQNTFCIWKGGQPANFELRLEYRMTGINDGNSGIQYRSIERPDVARWVMQGYQADIDLKQMFTGQIYEERARGFVALRGQLAYIGEGKKPAMVGSVGDNQQLKSLIKNDDWNSVDIIARDNILIQFFNGRLMSELIDDDPKGRKMQGEIGIQLHRLPNAAMKMETRNIRIKNF
ncbi:MAG: DUF1080 domain-containing protein [Bryobacteraceae bacterium]